MKELIIAEVNWYMWTCNLVNDPYPATTPLTVTMIFSLPKELLREEIYYT